MLLKSKSNNDFNLFSFMLKYVTRNVQFFYLESKLVCFNFECIFELNTLNRLKKLDILQCIFPGS